VARSNTGITDLPQRRLRPSESAARPVRVRTPQAYQLHEQGWGENFEDFVEYHDAQARAHEMAAAQLTWFARTLLEAADTQASLAETAYERAS
jgi:hypothetical protein